MPINVPGPESLGVLSCRKCPMPDLTFSKADKPTLWMIEFRNDEEGYEGQVAVTFGRHAERLARQFAASDDLVTVCRGVIEMLGDDCHAYKVGELARKTLAKINGEVTQR